MSVYSELRTFAVFQDVSADALHTLASHVQLREVAEQEVIINEGDAPDRLYVIIDGEFDVLKVDPFTGQRHVLTTLKPGDSIGEVSIIDAERRSAMIRAKTKSKVYVFSIDILKKFGYAYPQDYLVIIRNFAKIISTRLRSVNEMTAAALTAELINAELRVKMGRFIVLMIGLLCIYAFLLSFVSSLVRTFNTDLFASIVMLALILIPTMIILKYENFNLNEYGVNAERWQKNIIEAIVFTLPILAIIYLAKFAFIYYFQGLQHEPIFTGPLIEGRAHVYLFIALYILSCPLQELVARGILQGTLQRFLGSHTWASILVSNLIYSTLHLYLSYFYAIATFIPGLYFGWLYARQKSLLGPTIAHIMIGVFSIYLLGVHRFILP